MLRLLLVVSLIAPAPAGPTPGPVPQDSPPSAPGPSDIPPEPVPWDSPSGPVPEDSPPEPIPVEISGPPPVTSPSAQPSTSRRARFGRPQPTLRLGFGGAFAPAPESKVVRGFNVDVALGATFQVHKHVFLWPELGYNYTGRGARAGHFFTAGLAPMFGTELAQLGLAPRLVVGDAFGVAGIGVRSGLIASFGQHLLTIELGHQWVRAGGRDLHDGRFMFSVDMLMVLKAMAVLFLARKIVGKLR